MQRLDDDEGRRDRQARADDERRPRVDADGNREHRPDGEDDPDLQQRAGYRDPRDGAELADRELDAEREQEEDDAEVGELGDGLRVADEARRERPDDDARDEVAEDRRLPESNRDDAEDQRRRDGDPQVEDEPELAGQLEVQLHGRPRGQGGLGQAGHARIIEGGRGSRTGRARYVTYAWDAWYLVSGGSPLSPAHHVRGSHAQAGKRGHLRTARVITRHLGGDT